MFALDKEALQQLHAAGAQACYIADVQLHASSQGDQGSTPLADVPSRSSSFGSDDFKAIVRKKPLLLMRVLQVCVCACACVHVLALPLLLMHLPLVDTKQKLSHLPSNPSTPSITTPNLFNP